MTDPVPPTHSASLAPRVVLWGTYDTSKPRMRLLRQGMDLAGLEVLELHQSVWEDVADKSRIRGGAAKFRRAWRLICAYPSLLRRLLQAPRPDVLLVAYPGLLDVLVARVAATWWRIPLMFDVFISLYDTVVLDRRLLRTSSLKARLLRRFEKFSLRCADCAFMDTAAHARYVESLFELPDGHLKHVWVGAEAPLFPRLPPRHRDPDQALTVLFYGQFIPLHGIDTIVEAARLLQDQPVQWILIGEGQESPRIDALLRDQPLPRLRRIDWVAYDRLIDHMSQADVCLGIFGTSQKAASVIPNKVFQIAAAGRPFITRDSDAIREFVPRSSAGALLIPPGDPLALADAVRSLLQPKEANAAFPCAPVVGAEVVGLQFRALLESLLRDRTA